MSADTRVPFGHKYGSDSTKATSKLLFLVSKRQATAKFRIDLNSFGVQQSSENQNQRIALHSGNAEGRFRRVELEVALETGHLRVFGKCPEVLDFGGNDGLWDWFE
jgi:hypothetical protein